tara:strand:+ start:89 stop:808 length:720 start_codon:yes stop_codon:yes gene_type:complete
MKIISLLFLFKFITLCSFSHANENEIRKLLQKKLGDDSVIKKVSKTKFLNLYEVIVGREIIYTDKNAEFVFIGRVINSETSKDLTQERLDELNKIKFEELPINLSLRTINGKGKNKIAVFEDPNCGYCKKFRKTLEKINDTIIYSFPYPILSEDSINKVKKVLCAKDKNQAWHDLMINNKLPKVNSKDCDLKLINNLLETGRKLNVTGTPTIFFEDGSRIAGAINLKTLEKKLSQINSN